MKVIGSAHHFISYVCKEDIMFEREKDICYQISLKWSSKDQHLLLIKRKFLSI